MARLTMPCARLRKKKLFDSLLGDQRRWCWGFLGAAVDQVLGRLRIYSDKMETVRRLVTRLRTRVRPGELFATKRHVVTRRSVSVHMLFKIPNAQL
jgi:hypothetical protein